MKPADLSRVGLVLGLVAVAWPVFATGQPASSSGKEGVPTILTNNIGMEFVLIQAGSFTMGSPGDDAQAARDERPAHRVTLSRSFYLGRHEVTQAQWEAVMGSNPYDEKNRSNTFYELPGMAARIRHPDHPVTASWLDAQEFIRRLNAREGGERYRLPTEAEWEYAARAGTSTVYFFGNNDQLLSRYAWYGEDFDSGGTHPVGKKQPNPWGLYDMHGNVWEWTSDWHGEDYYARSPVDDPPGPAEGTVRVRRGGSWHTWPLYARVAFRNWNTPQTRYVLVGFRLLCEAPPAG